MRQRSLSLSLTSTALSYDARGYTVRAQIFVNAVVTVLSHVLHVVARRRDPAAARNRQQNAIWTSLNPRAKPRVKSAAEKKAAAAAAVEDAQAGGGGGGEGAGAAAMTEEQASQSPA